MKKDTRPLFQINWKSPFHAIVKITPEDARLVLERHNHGNRFLRQAGSRYIATQIRSGEWVEDHPQPICFSSTGQMIDGQHRMAGILLAEEPVWASVRFGVEPELMKYMDTGISRTLGDRVSFVDDSGVNKTIAAMVSLRHQMTVKGKPTPEQALQHFYQMEASYVAVASLRIAKRYTATAVVSLAFADYHHRYGDEALDMYREISKMTTNCQPAQALKAFLTTTPLVGPIQYPYIVSACLANHDRRQVKQLKAATWR